MGKNYEKQKPYYMNENSSQTNRINNKTYNLDILRLAVDIKGQPYDIDEATAFLSNSSDSGFFKNISIPVYMYKNDCNDNPTDKDYTRTVNVGYLTAVDNTGKFSVVVFGRFIEYVDRLSNACIHLTGRAKNGTLRPVQRIEIVSDSRFSAAE